jgi:hypothetical protein
MPPTKKLSAEDKRLVLQKRMRKLSARAETEDKIESKKEIEKLKALIAKKDEDLENEVLEDSIMEDADVADASDGEGDEQGGSASADDGKEKQEQENRLNGSQQPATSTPGARQGEDPAAPAPTLATPPATTKPGKSDGNKQPSAEATLPGQSNQGQPIPTIEGKQDQGAGNNYAPVKTEPSEESLFVPEIDPRPTEDTDPKEPLFGVPFHALGKDVTTVAWNSQARGGYINLYGKKGYMRFRIDDTSTPGYVKDPSKDYYMQALGDEKNGKRYIHTKDNFTGRIWGVAWKGEGGEDDLDLINPDLAGKRKDRNGNIVGKNWTETRVLVEWKGKFGKRWETRTTVRRLWGTKADTRIFEAAKKAETAYNSAGNNREGYTGSPQAPLQYNTVSPSQDRSVSPRSSSTDTMASVTDRLADFKTSYLDIEGVHDVSELTSEGKSDFARALMKEKKRLV